MNLQSSLIILSRTPQIISNFILKSTGNLSMLPYIMNLSGNIIRTLTIFKQSNDSRFLYASFVPIFLNGTIVLQFIIYYNSVKDKK